MSKVKNKDSKLEITFRKLLWENGFRYRKNAKKYFGKPDLVLKKHKTVIFIDSCFWHGCKRHGEIPATKRAFWVKKIGRNRERDKEVTVHYKKQRWLIFRIWEHDIKSKEALNRVLIKVLKRINAQLRFEIEEWGANALSKMIDAPSTPISYFLPIFDIFSFVFQMLVRRPQECYKPAQ